MGTMIATAIMIFGLYLLGVIMEIGALFGAVVYAKEKQLKKSEALLKISLAGESLVQSSITLFKLFSWIFIVYLISIIGNWIF